MGNVCIDLSLNEFQFKQNTQLEVFHPQLIRLSYLKCLFDDALRSSDCKRGAQKCIHTSETKKKN
jgi:hypothetical protein